MTPGMRSRTLFGIEPLAHVRDTHYEVRSVRVGEGEKTGDDARLWLARIPQVAAQPHQKDNDRSNGYEKSNHRMRQARDGDQTLVGVLAMGHHERRTSSLASHEQ